jgi:hypothetical protein
MKFKEGRVPRVEVGNRHKLIQTAILVIRGGQIPGGRSTWRLIFVRMRLMYMDSPSEILLHVALVIPRVSRWSLGFLSYVFIPVNRLSEMYRKISGTSIGSRHHVGFRNAFSLETNPIA